MQIITIISHMIIKVELLELQDKLAGETRMLEDRYVGMTKNVELLSRNGFEVMQKRQW